MDIHIVTLGPRATRKQSAAEDLFADYCQRLARHCRCERENFPSEEKFFAEIERQQQTGRVRPLLVLLDARGRPWSTETFADWLQAQRNSGAQRLIFAIGPADGWTAHARARASLLLSLGPMTLPHSLAAVVLAEQLYRAFTILQGLPYHLGHAGQA